MKKKNFDKESLVADFINIDWMSLIELQKADPINPCDKLLDKVNTIVDTHLPLKKVSEKDKKIQKKPGLPQGSENLFSSAINYSIPLEEG